MRVNNGTAGIFQVGGPQGGGGGRPDRAQGQGLSAERVDEALPYLARAYAQDERWAKLLPRLPRSGLLPEDPALMKRLVAGMKTTP